MAASVPTVFFAYSSKPELRRETLAKAAEGIGLAGDVEALTWEGIPSAGRLAISEILAAIDSAQVLACDTTELNQNVLFELGYAIGRRLPVWITRDTTDEAADRLWKRFGLLRSVYYAGYVNSDQLVAAFANDKPQSRDDNLFDTLIAPTLGPTTATSLFYFRSVHDTDASRALTRAIQDVLAGRSIVTIDPEEGAFKPLALYAQELNNTRAAIVHFTGGTRFEAVVHNARCAIVAGLALGMNRPVLMMAEPGYEPPFDYHELLYTYRNARDCESKAREWLTAAVTTAATAPRTLAPIATAMTAELRGLLLGSYIAEEERATLSEYFVVTRNYLEVLDPGTSIFVGRKGTGKTANFMEAASSLSDDRRNLVCAISPAGYELSSTVRLLEAYTTVDEKGYLVESLWKYLLFSELARCAAAAVRARPAPLAIDSPDARLLEMVDDPDGPIHEEFAVRLERAVQDLLDAPTTSGVEEGRRAISEALHTGILRRLREVLGLTLTGRQRIAILIDHLDRGWDRDANVAVLGDLLLGLLNAIEDVAQEFARSDQWRRPVAVSLAVFLRSDIFASIAPTARERDKLPTSELVWSDPEVLLRVIEDRYAASRGTDVDGAEIWDRFFTRTVDGIPTKTWLWQTVLPRPRDLLYLCNAAITHAVNRGHGIVQAEDVRSAEEDYSQFALDSVVVEGQVTISTIEDILYEFVGSSAFVSESDIRGLIDAKRETQQSTTVIMNFLTQVSFLGPRIGENRYRFLESLDDERRLAALADNAAQVRGRGRSYLIHPAFWSYLAIDGPKDRPEIR